MAKFETGFTKEYLRFRDVLNNDQLLNFRAQLTNAFSDGNIPENVLTILEVGGAAKFHIYVDRQNAKVWLLGGHWVRQGEPSKEHLARMKTYASDLSKGLEPGSTA